MHSCNPTVPTWARTRIIPFLVLGALLLLLATPGRGDDAPPFDHTHAALSSILKHAVARGGGGVDYARLKQNPVPLRFYLDTLHKVTEKEFRAWEPTDQLAYLINLYNAHVLSLVVEDYPIRSIEDLGSVFTSVWRRRTVPLFGRRISLDSLFHTRIRAEYHDHRIHFAICPAARSAPPLRAEAYRGRDLAVQFEDQARAFLNDPSRNWFDYERRRVSLSAIFRWYRDDFGDDGRLREIVGEAYTKIPKEWIARPDTEIGYLDYDRRINDGR